MSLASATTSRQFTPQKVGAVRRLKRWRACPVQVHECISGRVLVTRETERPGSVWPPRPRDHYRMPSTRGELTRLFTDLVQEQTERGAVGVILAHDDLVTLSGKSRSTCRRAVAEACRLGIVESWNNFEGRACACIVGGAKCTARHSERPKLYTLGPVALVELRRLAEARRRPRGYTERSISAERARMRQSDRNDSVIREHPIRDQKPEEATEDAQTAVPAESVAAPRPPERLFLVPSGPPSPNAPPIELRNSWTREAAARPPRGEGPAPGGRQRSLGNIGRSGPVLRLVESSPGHQGSDDPLAVMLQRLRQRFGDDDSGGL